MTDPNPEKIAGYLIDGLRRRDDIAHIRRYDRQNKRIDVIVEPDDLDDEAVIIPSDVLQQLSEVGFDPVSAQFSTNTDFSPQARVMGFERR